LFLVHTQVVLTVHMLSWLPLQQAEQLPVLSVLKTKTVEQHKRQLYKYMP